MDRDFLLRCTESRPTVENEDVFAKIEIAGRDVNPHRGFWEGHLGPDRERLPVGVLFSRGELPGVAGAKLRVWPDR